jgi:hypothetical protein
MGAAAESLVVDKTIKQFCRSHNISAASYYRLQALGLGPDVLHPPGTNIYRITPAAEAAWQERMAELARSEAAALEQARRVEQTSAAGRAAAASSAHISKQRAARPRGGKRYVE